MNYMGIDISKYKHDCFVLSDFGEVVNEGFSFANDAEGFRKLERLSTAKQPYGSAWKPKATTVST